jgi:putative transcriptional regulator
VVLNALSGVIPKSSAESFHRQQAKLFYRAAIPKTDPDEPGTREDLARGKFLVASRRLQDPNFKETVVLLVEYGMDGAMGVVINRPSTVRLATVFPDIKELKERKDTIYVGGPVAVNQMLMLIRSSNMPEESQEITRDVYISSSWKVLERLMKSASKNEKFRLFAGYAGWAPKQLDFERSRGDWYILKADAEMVFTQNPSELWPELIRRITAKWVRIENLLENRTEKEAPRNETTRYRRYARNRPQTDRTSP